MVANTQHIVTAGWCVVAETLPLGKRGSCLELVWHPDRCDQGAVSTFRGRIQAPFLNWDLRGSNSVRDSRRNGSVGLGDVRLNRCDQELPALFTLEAAGLEAAGKRIASSSLITFCSINGVSLRRLVPGVQAVTNS